MAFGTDVPVKHNHISLNGNVGLTTCYKIFLPLGGIFVEKSGY